MAFLQLSVHVADAESFKSFKHFISSPDVMFYICKKTVQLSS
ncbi:hypothetical protein ACU8KH_03476 [Lachancea thermotolerans]